MGPGVSLGASASAKRVAGPTPTPLQQSISARCVLILGSNGVHHQNSGINRSRSALSRAVTMSARIATGAYSASAMLNLYRSIIRLHRKKLPPALRTMGNTYVRHEFDLHKKANLTQVSPSHAHCSPTPTPVPEALFEPAHRCIPGKNICETVARVRGANVRAVEHE
jgi:hypothetical protein